MRKNWLNVLWRICNDWGLDPRRSSVVSQGHQVKGKDEEKPLYAWAPGGPGSHTSASTSKASVGRVSDRVVPFGKLVHLPKIVGNGLNVIGIERGLTYLVK